ncbi:hypothetical protein [Nocardia aurantia]|uniref:Low molecular weight antigen MTB12-like C-terminal domain-containing protein n=1 Tax=Nocardia aurantia TaxID=2585199 RepID=A0A7K0DKU9_9NOCA|nr:hypothetical protein [Nocardia aurantia]MQY26400.1 hypothetical protein [Nocardia aurantia]
MKRPHLSHSARGISIAAVALAALLAGCSDSPEQTTATASSTAAAAAAPGTCPASAKYPATPTLDQLNALLRRGLDPNVPAAQKVELVQGTEADPDIFNRMTAALKQADLSVNINNVTDHCDGTATADAVLTLNGQPNPGQVPLVADQGTWKLDKTWACGIVTTLGQSSSICS